MREVSIPAGHAREYADALLSRHGSGVPVDSWPPPAVAVERRLLHWCKINHPNADVPKQSAGVDVRVLLPPGPEYARLCSRLDAAGVPYRQVRYWLEAETISTVGERGQLGPLRATAELLAITNPAQHQVSPAMGAAAAAARDAFEMLWQTHAEPHGTAWDPVPAASLVPEEWLPYLPYQTLNPAQANAAPTVVTGRGHVVVTAPTGSGKTMIGMLAALKAILAEGAKAAWLVPQRSLTDELDRELAAWRARGLRVERLSGEYATDVRKVRDADLWVATTEKFEAICRAASLRAALAKVSALVVDEIHLLGDTERGPLLEALLARVRGDDSPVRIVGLSATAANAGQVATWLGAQLVHTTWRPSRLTWQLPLIPAGDRRTTRETRTQLTTAITTMITQDGGSVLVFCGSKRNVRTTALVIAASRGADTRGIAPDDNPRRLHEVCTAAGVGIHYKNWEHKNQAERKFRNRELDVLVATTTVAAGVNLPARAVIIRDTEIGLNKLNVATVQQMFGRAGRIGAGETEGWAYLITDETERATWQARLVEGYTVTSHIANSLADHLLAEVAQDRIHTIAEAEQWWTSTLAYHQGAHDLTPLQNAIDFLVDGQYLTMVSSDLTITELGNLTTRLMVPTETGVALRTTLASEQVPVNTHDAEAALGYAVARCVPQLAHAPIDEALRPLVARLLRANGNLESTSQPSGLAPADASEPGDLAQLAFILVTNHPRLFTRHRPVIAGLPTTIIYPILDEAPRYFTWLAAQGHLGTVHPWIAVVAGDLGRRIRWRRLAPTRGSGRLLWICEQMATTLYAETVVPDLFTAARNNDVANPDWPPGRPPRRCQLDELGYLTLLRDRATGTTFTENPDSVTITCPNAVTVSLWAGQNYQSNLRATAGTFQYPANDNGRKEPRGATVFTRRGEYLSHGWLATYNTISQRS